MMNRHWKLKYFEKNTYESHINIFRSLEIENYFKQLLKKQGFSLHNHRLNFSNSVLNIFLSVYKKDKTTSALRKKHESKTKKAKFFNSISWKNVSKSLNKFTNSKLHITLTIKIINTSDRYNIAKKILLNFRRFRIPEIKRLYLTLATQTNSQTVNFT
jgi:hypothetical protein